MSVQHKGYMFETGKDMCERRPKTSDSSCLCELCDHLHGEANISSASQEILCILWNPMVHCRAHKSLPLVQSMLFYPVPGDSV